VAHENHVHRILGRGLTDEAVERLVDLLERRLARDAGLALGGLVHQVHHVIGGHAQASGRLDEFAAPFVEQLAVLGIAREPDDDQQEDMEHQDNPTARRYPHSAHTRPTSMIRTIGMFQSSRCSTEATPRPA
jgi:hypothetical protein